VSTKCNMTIDRRAVDHTTLEQIRLVAIPRIREGEDPGAVISSCGEFQCIRT
jgi:hypothetical protein